VVVAGIVGRLNEPTTREESPAPGVERGFFFCLDRGRSVNSSQLKKHVDCLARREDEIDGRGFALKHLNRSEVSIGSCVSTVPIAAVNGTSAVVVLPNIKVIRSWVQRPDLKIVQLTAAKGSSLSNPGVGLEILRGVVNRNSGIVQICCGPRRQGDGPGDEGLGVCVNDLIVILDRRSWIVLAATHSHQEHRQHGYHHRTLKNSLRIHDTPPVLKDPLFVLPGGFSPPDLVGLLFSPSLNVSTGLGPVFGVRSAFSFFSEGRQIREISLISGPNADYTALRLNAVPGRRIGMTRLYIVLLLIYPILVLTAERAIGQADPADEGSVSKIRDLVYRGEFGEAEARARQLLAQVTDNHGKDGLETATVMDLLVDILSRAGKIGDGEAIALADEAIRIKLSELGEDHPDVAASRYYRGWLYLLLGDLEQAEPELLASLAIREQHLSTDDPSIAQSLNGLGCLYYYRSEYEEATEALRRAVAIREKVLGPEHPDLAVSLSNLANVYADQGELQQAEALVRQSLAIRTRYLGSDHPSTADSIHNLGLLRLEQGAYVEAWSLIRHALQIWTEVMGPESYEVLLAKHSSALVLNSLGDYEQAAVVFAEVCDRIASLRGPDHPDLGSMLLNLGNLQHKTGDFNAARDNYEKALTLVSASFGTAHASYGRLLLNYGVLLGDMGDFGEALLKTEEAIDVLTDAYDSFHPQVAIARLSLASHLMALDRQDEAAEQIRVALEILTETHAEAHPDLARALLHRAESLASTGKSDQAVALSDEALRIFQLTLAADHPLVAAALIDRGWYQYQTGYPTEALSDYAEAERIWQEIFGTEHPLFGRLRERQALALYRENMIQEALANALAAESAGRIHLQLSMRLLSERQALRYATNRPSGLYVALSILAADNLPDELGRVYHALINSRGLVLDEMILRSRRLHWDPTPEQKSLLQESQEYRSRLAHLLLGDPQDVPAAVQKEQLDFARHEQERVERALAAAEANMPLENSVAEVGVADLQKQLGPNELLVSFLKYDHIDWSESGANPRGNTGSQAAYVAFILDTRSVKPTLVTLGKAAELDRLVANWHREASTGEFEPGRSPRAAREAYRHAASQLRERIWDPLAPYLVAARSVLVVRDGSLNLLNFDVLVMDDGTFLLESGPILRYLSAERDLLRNSTDPGRGLLVLGDPSFDVPPVNQISSLSAEVDQPAQPQLRGLIERQWTPLPATRAEAEIAVRLWREGLSGGEEEVIQLLGPDASESMLKRYAPGRKVLHLATHGFFLAPGGTDTSPSTNSQKGKRFVPDYAWIRAENPLLLSGLILAGASTSRSATDSRDDGILTAEEIASLNLTGVELAVLSACGTGLGAHLAGEGVFGLQRAFQIAGAGQLVLSLWPVADEDTTVWMETYYRLCARKNWFDLVGAVRQAALTILQDRRRNELSTHPFHWGAFIAVGDGHLTANLANSHGE